MGRRAPKGDQRGRPMLVMELKAETNEGGDRQGGGSEDSGEAWASRRAREGFEEERKLSWRVQCSTRGMLGEL